jgi:putative methyltransferase (TIGR04325 family)
MKFLRTRASALIKLLIPPVIYFYLNRIVRRNFIHRFKFGYDTWKSAAEFSGSYENPSIVGKVRRATLDQVENKVKFSMDGFGMDKIHYSWPVTASLMCIQNIDNRISVLDIGGGLGTLYFQNIRFVEISGGVFEVCVLEQDKYCRVADEVLSHYPIKFVRNLQELDPNFHPNIIHFGSSIPYIENINEIILEVLTLNPQYILIDRTPMSSLDYDIYSIEYPPPHLYGKISYPLRILSQKNFFNKYFKDYEVIEEWDSLHQPYPNSISKGFFLRRTTL